MYAHKEHDNMTHHLSFWRDSELLWRIAAEPIKWFS